MKFTVYSKNGCPYCSKVKQVLELSKLEHVIYKLGEDFDRGGFILSLVKDLPFLKLW